MANAGDFDQRVTFQRTVTAPDGLGGAAVTWTDAAKAWAMVTPARQSESERQGALRASRTYTLTLRRREDITEAMRILWRSEVMNIREIKRGGPRELTMQITAEAGVTQ